MNTRDVGKMGEKTFELWTGHINASANKSGEDKTGWDYIVEFPLPRANVGSRPLPLDKAPIPIKCLVQVKSTDDRKRRRVEVKLSNWVRLVKSALPAFFLVLEFDNQLDCQRAFFVHVDEALIRAVLKKLRKMKVDDESKLHEKVMYLSYKKALLLSQLNGIAVKEAVQSFIGPDLDEYTRHKLDLVKNVGYENGAWAMKFVVKAPSGTITFEELLANFSIGLTPHLDVLRGEVQDIRFGIPAPAPTEVFDEGGVLKVDPVPAGKATLVFANPAIPRKLRVECDVYVPQGFDHVLPQEHHKWRYAAPFFDLITRPYTGGEGQMNFRFPRGDEENELQKLRTLSNIVLFLHRAPLEQTVLDILVNDLHIGGVRKTNFTEPIPVDIIKVAELIDFAWVVAKHFDLYEAKVTLDSLIAQHSSFILLGSLLARQEAYIRITTWIDQPVVQDDLSFCVPYAQQVIIGSYVIIVGVAFTGRLTTTGTLEEGRQEYEFYSDAIQLHESFVYTKGETLRHTRQQILSSIEAKYEDNHHILQV